MNNIAKLSEMVDNNHKDIVLKVIGCVGLIAGLCIVNNALHDDMQSCISAFDSMVFGANVKIMLGEAIEIAGIFTAIGGSLNKLFDECFLVEKDNDEGMRL